MTRLFAFWSTLVDHTICQHHGHRTVPVGGWQLCARCGHDWEGGP